MKFLKNWTIDLEKIPKYTAFEGKFIIDVDYELLRLCYESDKPEFTPDRKLLLAPILEKINKKNNTLMVSHSQAYGLGRFYPENSISPINVSRHIKHTLFSYLDWVDLDMVKGHPTILYNLATQNNIPIKSFKTYLQNPTAIFNELIEYYSVSDKVKLTEDNVKDIFNIHIYGGGHSTWLKQMKKDGYFVRDDIAPHKFECEFKNDCKKLMDLIYLNNPLLADKVKDDLTDENEIKRRVMSYFCGIVENDIIYVCKKFLIKQGVIKNRKELLEYDGLCFKRPDNLNLEIFIKPLNDEIKSKCKMDITMKWKNYKAEYVHNDIIEKREQIKFTPQESLEIEYADEDNYASQIIFGRLKDRLKSYKGRIFYKFENIWEYDSEKIDNFILNFILNSRIYRPSKFEDIPYCQNVKSAKNIREALYIKIKIDSCDDDLYKKFHSTTKNRICFKDGVLDFIQRKFYKWEEIEFEYYSCVMINRNYGDYFVNPDLKVVNDIKDKIFGNMFGNKTETALHFLSRAIGGLSIDKNFATYLGNRDCGKGVLYDALENAFETYIRTFELGNIMYHRRTAGLENIDCSKKLYWLIDLEFVRLGISQEIPDHKSEMSVNSKMLKKIAGGGDTIVARRNYDRMDTHFTTDTTFFMMGNSSLNYDNEDCKEHLIEFNSVNQFKTQEEINAMITNEIDSLELQRYKVKDPTIKSKCETEEWKNAVVYLLFQSFKDLPVSIIKEKDEEDDSLLSKIKENLIITNNQKDVVLCDDVHNTLCGFDKKKIVNELQAINVFKKKSNSGTTRNKWCYYGIQIKPENTNIE